MATFADVLDYKISECDRRILAEIKALQENLGEVQNRVESGGFTWAFGNSVQSAANRLDQYLTERSTLQQVQGDLVKVQEQQP